MCHIMENVRLWEVFSSDSLSVPKCRIMSSDAKNNSHQLKQHMAFFPLLILSRGIAFCLIFHPKHGYHKHSKVTQLFYTFLYRIHE